MGSRTPRLIAAWLLTATVVALPGTASARSVRPTLAPTPNSSIVFYKPPANGKPGRAVVGTLVNGVYTRKGTFRTGRWTNIAVGRDTMALYDRATGRLLTGRFRNGVWKPVKTRTIATGYTHVVASCDSILFYKRPTGTGKSADLLSGDIYDMRNAVLDGDPFKDDYRLLGASCDTLLALGEDGDGDGSVAQVGLLRDGHFRDVVVGLYSDSPGWSRLTANSTSYLKLSVPASGRASGAWGQLQDGDVSQTGTDDQFELWDIVAGAADSVLFYMRPSGTAWSGVLVSGNDHTFGPLPTSIGKGWRIIAGGK